MRIKKRYLEKKKYLENKQIEINNHPLLKGIALDKIDFCNGCKNWYEIDNSCYCRLIEIDENRREEERKAELLEKSIKCKCKCYQCNSKLEMLQIDVIDYKKCNNCALLMNSDDYKLCNYCLTEFRETVLNFLENQEVQNEKV